MKRMLLTSTGLSNTNFQKLFLRSVGKTSDKIKVIFLPTAAIDDDARQMLPYCHQDLTNAGIPPENIFVYDLNHIMSKDHPHAHRAGLSDINPAFRLLSYEELMEFDAIYFCGGDPSHLLNEINRTGFNVVLKQAIENDLFYIGTSAGAIIAAGNLRNNLGYIKNKLNVHCGKGTPCGKFSHSRTINLTNEQAIWIEGECVEIIK